MLHYEQEWMNENFIKHHINVNGLGFVVHQFKKPDIGHIHDHPFAFNTYILKGWYKEKIYYPCYDGKVEILEEICGEGSSHRVEARTIHEITDMSPEGCWTIITPEAREQDWKFWRFDEQGIWYRYPNEQEFTLLNK